MIASVLAIDPGACTGWALFQCFAPGWRMIGAGVASPEENTFPVSARLADLVVIECPERNYGRMREKDLVTLARVVGRYEERFRSSRIELVAPRSWKGTIDGDIMTARIEAAMTPAEVAILDTPKRLAKSYRHNAIDAVGLGKWALRQPFMRAK